ncbi:hypothetical protein LR48_Vigan11g114200 [Vigna angularis]|uniref:Uncharacterized protein n=1 Tax=Phaseolus angularis TaxID=3914 RepID=A0A0L9VT38_PHAAN|nr:hypothetical protein LR48_Vigan11g114200 [Vigna angularis]
MQPLFQILKLHFLLHLSKNSYFSLHNLTLSLLRSPLRHQFYSSGVEDVRLNRSVLDSGLFLKA